MGILQKHRRSKRNKPLTLLQVKIKIILNLFFSSRRRHTRLVSDWSSDVCSSDLKQKTAYELVSDWSSDVCSSDRSEEHTSELQSLTNLVCRLLLGSEEHTSELQSLTNLVCRLLLEKKRQEERLQARDRVRRRSDVQRSELRQK